jgi:uncharacterized membrane protein (Fun14 family)
VLHNLFQWIALDEEDAKMDFSNLGVESLAIGAITGYFVGYLLKKLLHLALMLGVFAFLLMYMTHIDAIDLNYEEMAATVTGYSDVFLNRLGFEAFISNTSFVGSFFIGLFLGLRRG